VPDDLVRETTFAYEAGLDVDLGVMRLSSKVGGGTATDCGSTTDLVEVCTPVFAESSEFL